jgi:hypothetical protein
MDSEFRVDGKDVLYSLQSTNDWFDDIGVYPSRRHICTTKEEGEASEERMGEVGIGEMNRE